MTETTTRAQRTSTWDQLGTPLRALIWLLSAAAALAIYRMAEALVSSLFSVLLLFVFASIIAIVLTPLVDGLQRVPAFRTHRSFAVLFLYVLFLAPLVGLGFLVVPSLVTQSKQLPTLAANIQTQINSWGLPVNLDALRTNVANINFSAGLGVISGLIGTLVSIILVLVISIYLMAEGRTVIATLRNILPTRTRPFDFVVLAVGSVVQAYVRGQIIMSLLIGTYTAVTMQLLGVHYALVLGAAAAILELVPIVGSLVAMSLAAGVALLQGPTIGLEAIALGLIGHGLEAYVVSPRINGRATQLNPLVAMSALLIGGTVGGILGALFAVPLAAIANIILGAAYRARQGDAPLSTHAKGKIKEESLPRLGEEIAEEATGKKG